MSDIQNVEMKPQDRIAQAGILLVEQAGMALVSDAYKFPNTSTGHIQSIGNDGTLKIDGAFNETVKTTMKARHDDKSTYFAIWNHTDVVDSLGQSHNVDQINGGDFLTVLVNNRLGSHTDFKANDGSTQLQMDGQTAFTPKDGVINDSSNVIKDAAGNYLGEVHIVAKPTQNPNVLGIAAQYKYHDIYLGDVGALITLDPNSGYKTADFQIEQVYNPPPPAPPPAAAPAGK